MKAILLLLCILSSAITPASAAGLGPAVQKIAFTERVEQVLPEGILFISDKGTPWLLTGYPGQKTAADGQVMKFYATNTGKTFSYTDTTGAKRTARVWAWAGKRMGR